MSNVTDQDRLARMMFPKARSVSGKEVTHDKTAVELVENVSFEDFGQKRKH